MFYSWYSRVNTTRGGQMKYMHVVPARVQNASSCGWKRVTLSPHTNFDMKLVSLSLGASSDCCADHEAGLLLS